ncbi:MAG TPA: YdcF family protein, partial [Plasticicumulans sp.]|nr:YdcF family protein [Plasticicumulans sp.]
MLELFLLPPGGPLCLALLGLLLRLRRPRLGSALITTGLLAAWLLSTPQMAATLNRALAPPPVLSDEAIR